MINILRIPVDKVDSMQKQIGKYTERDGNSKKEPKSNARDKNTEECLDGLLSNTGHVFEENPELQDIMYRILKTEKQKRTKNWGRMDQNRLSKDCGKCKKYKIHVTGKPEGMKAIIRKMKIQPTYRMEVNFCKSDKGHIPRKHKECL